MGPNKTSTVNFVTSESRRSILTTLISTGLLFKANSSISSYGDSANVFGKTTNKSGFLAYAGEGFSLLLPSKWNPSKERDFFFFFFFFFFFLQKRKCSMMTHPCKYTPVH